MVGVDGKLWLSQNKIHLILHPPPSAKLCIILTILLIGSQFSIVPSLYYIGDNKSPLHSP